MDNMINNPIYQLIIGGAASGFWFVKWITSQFNEIHKKIDKLTNQDTCSMARDGCNKRLNRIEQVLNGSLKD